MSTRYSRLAVFALSLTAVSSMYPFAQPAAPQVGDDAPAGMVITLDKAPEPVRTSAVKLAGNPASITKVTREEAADNVYIYQVEFRNEGANCAAILSSTGELMELSRPAAALPATAMEALKREFPNAKFDNVKTVVKTFYVVSLTIDGETGEVSVDAAGNIEGQ